MNKPKKIIIFISVVVLIFSIMVFPCSANFAYSYIPVLTAVKRGNTSFNFTTGTYAYYGLGDYWCKATASAGDLEYDFDFQTNNVSGDIVEFSCEFICEENVTPHVYFGGCHLYSANGLYLVETFEDVNGNIMNLYRASLTHSYSGSVVDSLVIILRGSGDTSYFWVHSFNYKCTGDGSAAVNAARDSINANTNQAKDEIKANQDRNTQRTIDEEYGYSKPDSSGTDDGIDAGGNLLDSLTEYVDDFNDTISSSTSNLLDSLSGYRTVVHSIFDTLPLIVQYLVVFALVFLVLRKVVGR